MDRETRRDLLVMGAGLLGVAVGYAVRSYVESEESPAEKRPDRHAMIVPSVLGSMAVSNRLGTILPIDDDDVYVHAIVAAGVGAVLSYSARGFGKLGPRIAMLLR